MMHFDMRKLIAKLFGWKVVWLVDFDGEVTKRLARPTQYGLLAYRMSRIFKISPVLCLSDGTVKGASFVRKWSSLEVKEEFNDQRIVYEEYVKEVTGKRKPEDILAERYNFKN